MPIEDDFSPTATDKEEQPDCQSGCTDMGFVYPGVPAAASSLVLELDSNGTIIYAGRMWLGGIWQFARRCYQIHCKLPDVSRTTSLARENWPILSEQDGQIFLASARLSYTVQLFSRSGSALVQVRPQQSAVDAGDALDLDHTFRWHPIPLPHRRASEPYTASNSRHHPSLLPDQGHPRVHAERIPQVTKVSKRFALPPARDAGGTPLVMAIGHRIRRARLLAGLTQRELARRLHVSHGAVSQWESHIKSPSRDNLRKIADVTGADVAQLLQDGNHLPEAVRVSDKRELRVLQSWRRLTRRQQDNLLELLEMSADVRRQIEKQRKQSN